MCNTYRSQSRGYMGALGGNILGYAVHPLSTPGLDLNCSRNLNGWPELPLTLPHRHSHAVLLPARIQGYQRADK